MDEKTERTLLKASASLMAAAARAKSAATDPRVRAAARAVQGTAVRTYRVATSEEARKVYASVAALVQDMGPANDDDPVSARRNRPSAAHYGCEGTHATKAEQKACNRRRAVRERYGA